MKFVVRDVTLINQFHQAFYQWLDLNQSRFSTSKFEFSDNESCVVTFTISGLHQALFFVLYSRGISMCYQWQGVHWTLKTFEALPVITEDSYVDGLSQDEYPSVYVCREALWIDLIFEPFLAWVNSELLPPRWLARHALARPLTTAHFIDRPNSNWRVILPIWINQDQ